MPSTIRWRTLDEEIIRMHDFMQSFVRWNFVKKRHLHLFNGILICLHKLLKGRQNTNAYKNVLEEATQEYHLSGCDLRDILNTYSLSIYNKKLLISFCRVYCYNLVNDRDIYFHTHSSLKEYLFDDNNINEWIDWAIPEVERINIADNY